MKTDPTATGDVIMRTCLYERQPSGGRLHVPSNVSALSDACKAEECG